MLKRKPSGELRGDGPRASIYDTDNKRRRSLFRTKRHKKTHWAPEAARKMNELLEFVLQHEEAFKDRNRIKSLYADFRHQLETNPEGYHANIAAWTKALSDAARGGVIPSQGTTHDLLSIRATDELARALQHPQYGKPTCLPAVFHEAVQKKEMVPLNNFLTSKESIYKTSWIPSPWMVLQWSLRQVGVLGQPQSPEKLGVGNFVVVKNVEVAADEILKKMKEQTSTADRVLSKADFLKRFSTALNPSAPLTRNDLDVLLVYLARDKHAISYNAQTIKFKPEHDSLPLPVTDEDAAIANLRDTLANIHVQLPPLMEKIAAAQAAAREAVAVKEMVRAKAALRTKKLAESALAHRADVAHQLEQVYTDLQHAADQVEIVEAMRAGAAALKGLNDKVGGAEGVQGVVDAVNEQMATTEEITNIISETNQPLDEGEIDDEFEALEKADREQREKEEAQRTAARLAKLEVAERKHKEKLAAEAKQREKEAAEAKKTEDKVDETSQSFANMSFQQPDNEDDDEMEDAEQDGKRVPRASRRQETPALHTRPNLTSTPHQPNVLTTHTHSLSTNTQNPQTMHTLRALTRTPTFALAAHRRRPFSVTRTAQSGGHGPSYDPPTGWLFGVKPGEQYEKEGWEGAMFWGFGGACLFGVVAYAFKPDTSIQTWALEEARRRLEAEGILVDPDTVKKE
ncbi:hypothetical protein BDW02DRAFT_585120 [Decorospora gaudefroyi]|uniref:NADH dehydrogenase [ubiquinone] 1 beta subcomplex subunit 11, mitochondrial n=1 Tax=Decorospora gaudefroyi TaxID=184978 RepID=A0A6A5KWT5_9PLEO|nr:hypothetical protein BDW02DRAFT_585120 [Decorospora gaudefroyi]